MKKFKALDKISRRNFLRLSGSMAGAAVFSGRCLSLPEALAAPAGPTGDRLATCDPVIEDTPDEPVVDIGPALDLFWAAVEPYRMDLALEHFRHLVMGLAYLNYAYRAFEAQCQAMQWALSDPDGEAYVADEAQRAGVLAEMVENPEEHLSPAGEFGCRRNLAGRRWFSAVKLSMRASLWIKPCWKSSAGNLCLPG
jgi:hypothetical protein